MNLLPINATLLERRLAMVSAVAVDLNVPLRDLWDPNSCPVELLPYLAWAFSVDRWDENWSENTKRGVVRASHFVHRHKGTISALRRVIEPMGLLLEVREWWQIGGTPGTFQLTIGVLETGITVEMYQELERLIDDAKPVTRHLTGMTFTLTAKGSAFVGASSYDGEILTVYAYTPDAITVGGYANAAAAIHTIDMMRVSNEH